MAARTASPFGRTTARNIHSTAENMATREELAIIRSARAGKTLAQTELGRRYLSGDGALPKNMQTALHWLSKAAHQKSLEACLLIGAHIPIEVARQAGNHAMIYPCFERAFDCGHIEAGLVFAKLVLNDTAVPAGSALRGKAVRALRVAAEANIAGAQWLLAQHVAGDAAEHASCDDGAAAHEEWLKWASRAAAGGVSQARHALAEDAWARSDHAAFLYWTLPLARVLCRPPRFRTTEPGLNHLAGRDLDAGGARLLFRCAHALLQQADADQGEVQRFLLLAAQRNDRTAQLSLGLWFARMNADGTRATSGPTSANYKQAVYWLVRAGAQGAVDALYVLSRIYLKVEFSQRSLEEAQRYRAQAAESGHRQAQFECGIAAWRNRHRNASGDVQAVYWLQKAASQGCPDATALLAKVTVLPSPALWALAARSQLAIRNIDKDSFMAARIELAAMFGLSRAEALLLDLNQADRGGFLLVELRVGHRCGKRRIILLQTAEQRVALTRIAQIASDIDVGAHKPEQILRNYLQRLYRLGTSHTSRTLAPSSGYRKSALPGNTGIYSS